MPFCVVLCCSIRHMIDYFGALSPVPKIVPDTQKLNKCDGWTNECLRHIDSLIVKLYFTDLHLLNYGIISTAQTINKAKENKQTIATNTTATTEAATVIKSIMLPGWVARMVGTSSHAPKGRRFDSQLGHVQETMDQCFSRTYLFLSIN